MPHGTPAGLFRGTVVPHLKPEQVTIADIIQLGGSIHAFLQCALSTLPLDLPHVCARLGLTAGEG